MQIEEEEDPLADISHRKEKGGTQRKTVNDGDGMWWNSNLAENGEWKTDHDCIHPYFLSVDISTFFTTSLDPPLPSSLPSAEHYHKVQELRTRLDEVQNKAGFLVQPSVSKQHEEEGSQPQVDDILSQSERIRFYAPNCQNPDLILKLKRLDDLRYLDMNSERVENEEEEENNCTSLSLLAMQQYYFYWSVCLLMCGDYDK